MMRDARYAQKRHTSYLQAHTDAIILFLLKKRTQSSNSYSNSKQKQANEGLQVCLLISSKIFRDSCLILFCMLSCICLSKRRNVSISAPSNCSRRRI